MNESRSRGVAAMEALSLRLIEIRRIQKRFTVQVLVINAAIYAALLLCTGSTDAANKVYTNTFQYQAVAWCCWFMLPYFLRAEAKQEAGMAMGRDSVDVLEKVDGAIESRLERVDRLLTDLEEMTRGHGVIGELKAEVHLLRVQMAPPNPATIPDPLLDPATTTAAPAHVLNLDAGHSTSGLGEVEGT